MLSTFLVPITSFLFFLSILSPYYLHKINNEYFLVNDFSTHHFNTTGREIYQDENQHGNFSGHQIKWKKVRKKNLDKYFSHRENVIPEKWHGTNNTYNLTFSRFLDAEEPLYLGYARNPFGSSVLWNKNQR